MNGLDLVVHTCMCTCLCDVTVSQGINVDVNAISRHIFQ